MVTRKQAPQPDLNLALKLFEKSYPDPRSELNFSNPFQLSVAVLLSAQCTDKKVNQVTPVLFKRFNSFQALAEADLAEIESIIKPINYYRTKSRHLIELGRIVREKFGGKFPLNRADAISLPGIGNKTANVVLGELGVEHTFPVDTHVFRVSQRLGWTKGKTPGEIEMQLKKIFPSDAWRNLHHWLILHGRRVCKAQNPACSECTLLNICSQKGLKGQGNKNQGLRRKDKNSKSRNSKTRPKRSRS